MTTNFSRRRVRASFRVKWFLPLLVLGVGSLAFLAVDVANTVQYETSLAAARTYSKTVSAMRDQYDQATKLIAAQLAEAPGHVALQSLPGPYGFLSDVSETLPAAAGGRFSVFSEFPWPNRKSGGLQTELKRELWRRIGELGEPEVVLEREDGDGRSIVYAEPIVMREACIGCHNTSPESPRGGWKAGDVRGVQMAEVRVPLGPLMMSAATKSSLLTLVLFGGLAILGFWILSVHLSSVTDQAGDMQLLHRVAYSIGDGIICLNQDGLVTEFNPAAEELFGYTRAEVLGESAEKLMASEDRERHRLGLEYFVKSGGRGQNANGEPVAVRAFAKSGEEFPVSMVVSLVQDIHPMQVVATLRDLRPTLKHDRVASFLEATFESIDEGVTIYDENLELVAWNARYESMDTGLDPKFLRYGANLVDLYREASAAGVFGEGDPDEILESRISAIQNGPLIENELLRSPSGSAVRINRFRLPNGGICATFRDVTEKRRMEEELRQAQKMEAVGRLAGGIAHDINNILAVVLGYAEILLDQNPEEQDAELLRGIADAANRGAETTHRLLVYSRKQPLQPAAVAIGPLLESCDLLLKSVLGEHVEFEADTPDNLWMCKVDKAQFEAILLNLALNSRDAMPRGGQLRIEAENETIQADRADALAVPCGDYVCISVADTGAGMDPEVLKHAFDPFYTTKAVGEGTGLGLAMAHGFVKQSNGAISISSGSTGTTVRIYLPRCHASAIPVAQSSDSVAVAPSGHVVLIVEDEESVRSLLTHQVELFGCSTLVAADGVEALEYLSSDVKIDVMLTDMVLPGEYCGWELAGIAQDLRPALAMVFMSGYSEDALGEHGQLDDRAKLLRKPFRMSELTEALTRALSESLSGAPG